VELLIKLLAQAPVETGDASALAYKAQLKLREFPDWPKLVKDPHRLLVNLLSFQHMFYLKLVTVRSLLDELLKNESECIKLMRIVTPQRHMTLY